jgi:antitoxin VapB
VPYIPMALDIEDGEVDDLAEELARRMGDGNKSRAVRDALRAQLALLEFRAGDRDGRLVAIMEAEIWPLRELQASMPKADREAILGYDPKTGV